MGGETMELRLFLSGHSLYIDVVDVSGLRWFTV